MLRKKILGLSCAISVSGFSPIALAHPAHEAGDFLHDMLHAMFGVDHLFSAAPLQIAGWVLGISACLLLIARGFELHKQKTQRPPRPLR